MGHACVLSAVRRLQCCAQVVVLPRVAFCAAKSGLNMSLCGGDIMSKPRVAMLLPMCLQTRRDDDAVLVLHSSIDRLVAPHRPTQGAALLDSSCVEHIRHTD